MCGRTHSGSSRTFDWGHAFGEGRTAARAGLISGQPAGRSPPRHWDPAEGRSPRIRWRPEASRRLRGSAGNPPLPCPAGRSGHMAVYDPASDAMTIFGGIGLPAETWTAAHASGLTQPPVWTLTNSGVPVPDPRDMCSAVLDTNSFSMIVFGGLSTDLLNAVVVLSPVM